MYLFEITSWRKDTLNTHTVTSKTVKYEGLLMQMLTVKLLAKFV